MSYKRILSTHRDKNEGPILKSALKMGATWAPFHRKDLPDGVLGWMGHSLLLEFKNPERDGKQRKQSEGQKTFANTWRGSPVHVIETEDQLLLLMKRYGPEPNK